MSLELEQIKSAYETLGMSPEEIAADRELDLAATKAALMQCSAKYRRDCGKESDTEDTLNFSDQDLRDVNEVILNTAKYAEDENLRLKAAMYIRDDKKGRKEVVKQIAGQQFNVLMFNEQMQRVRSLADAAKQKVINLAS